MDGSYELDIDALRDSIDSVDHVLFRFGPIPERLFIDFRSSEDAGPGIYTLKQVASFSERLNSIQEVRPGFPLPERLQVVSWPLRVSALERLGVLQVAKERLAEADAFEAIRQLDATIASLKQMEVDEIQRAISGEGYHTLWSVDQSKSDGLPASEDSPDDAPPTEPLGS